MKKKRKLKTRVILSFIYTLLILCMIDFSFILPTNSKFITAGEGGKEGTALVYQVGLYPLYVNTPAVRDEAIGITIDENDKDIFNFTFEFKRHYDIAYDLSETNHDNYSFGVTPGCTIIKINDSTDNLSSINFNERGDVDSKVKVELQCNYNTIKGNSTKNEVTISVGIKEKFGIEDNYEREFLYTEPSFIITDDYYKELSGKIVWRNTLEIPKGTSATDRVNTYRQWVEEYVAPRSGYELLVKKYLLKVGFENYITYSADPDSDWYDDSYGIIRKYKQQAYTYTISDNLVGYVRTDSVNKINSNHMYFTTKNEQEIATAFNIYLVEYQKQHNYTDADMQEIKEYISVRGGIANVVLGKKHITGLTIFPSDNLLVLDERLLEYAKNLKDKYSDIIRFDYKTIMNTDFTGITSRFEEIISPGFNFYNALRDQFGDSTSRLVYKNNVQDYSIPASFIDYYIVWDDGLKHYVILKIWSDVTKDATHQYNTYEFRTLAIETREGFEQPSIVFSNSSSNPDRLSISIELKANNQEEAEEIIFDDILIPLREYFGQEISNDSVNFEWDETDKYASATFSISKGYDDLLPSGGVGSAQRSKVKTETAINVVEETISSMNSENNTSEDEPSEIINEEQHVDENVIADVKDETTNTEEVPKVVENEVEEDNQESSDEVNVDEVESVEESIKEETIFPMVSSIMSYFLKK